MEEEQGSTPFWFDAMVNANFCIRKSDPDNDLKYVCISCPTNSLTEAEVKSNHIGSEHRVLKVFSVSQAYGYNSTDITKMQRQRLISDFSDIAFYRCNKYCYYMAKTRLLDEEFRTNKSGSCCFLCGWRITHQDGKRYCSLLCKYRSYPEFVRHDVQESELIMGGNQVVFDKKKRPSETNKKADNKKRKAEGEVREEPRNVDSEELLSSCRQQQSSEEDDDSTYETKAEAEVREEPRKVVKKLTSGLKYLFELSRRKREAKAKAQAKKDKQKKKQMEKQGSASEVEDLGLLASVATQKQNSLSYRKRSRKGIPCRAPLS